MVGHLIWLVNLGMHLKIFIGMSLSTSLPIWIMPLGMAFFISTMMTSMMKHIQTPHFKSFRKGRECVCVCVCGYEWESDHTYNFINIYFEVYWTLFLFIILEVLKCVYWFGCFLGTLVLSSASIYFFMLLSYLCIHYHSLLGSHNYLYIQRAHR